MRRARLPLLLAALATASPARAGDEFNFAPYLWIPSVSGTAGSGGGSDVGLGERLDVDLSENMRLGGAMVNLGLRRGRWVAFGDWTYANVRSDTPTPRETLYSSVDAQIIGNIVQAYGGYNLLERHGVRVDATAGARLYALGVRFGLEGGALDGRELESDAVWADGVAALRADFRRGPWAVYTQADLGAGGSSSSWQLIGAGGYLYSWGGFFAGWRHLSVDHEEDSFKLDLVLSGPILGGMLRF
jgi:hypothetical protein